MINRLIYSQITQRFFKGKVILLYGPRQVGKTTLIKAIAHEYKTLWLNGDESDIKVLFEKPTSSQLKNLVGSSELIVIDEAQTIPNIGLVLKLMVDTMTGIQIIATGSSSFELADKLSEPLTGRKYEFRLFPFSFEELKNHSNLLNERRLLEQRLLFGSYPEVVNEPGDARQTIELISNSYLYKDILRFGNIKKPHVLEKLVQALALQIGQEVSYNELSQLVGVDKETIERYIDILEKAFVVFRLSALNRNVRNELKKAKKVYFYDTGIRNAIIKNFNPLALRNDVGGLWENYLVAERMKRNSYKQMYVNSWFWRTSTQQEIDYLEEEGGQINAWEFKWKPKKNVRFPSAFLDGYPGGTTQVVDQTNFENFLL